MRRHDGAASSGEYAELIERPPARSARRAFLALRHQSAGGCPLDRSADGRPRRRGSPPRCRDRSRPPAAGRRCRGDRRCDRWPILGATVRPADDSVISPAGQLGPPPRRAAAAGSEETEDQNKIGLASIVATCCLSIRRTARALSRLLHRSGGKTRGRCARGRAVTARAPGDRPRCRRRPRSPGSGWRVRSDSRRPPRVVRRSVVTWCTARCV